MLFRSAVESPAPIEIADINGVKLSFPAPEKKATLIIFITNDCPVSNGYAPEINRICDEYSGKAVAVVLAHVDPALGAEAARKHAADFAFRCPVLIDSRHALVALTKATVTPEAAVLTPDGKIAYRGRIDDLYVDYGKKRTAPAQRDLREALDAVLGGKDVPHATTQAIGCFIPKLKGEEK